VTGGWHVGCGSADVTGELWDAGLLGYGMRWQRTQGLHLRQRSRAFAVADPATGSRLVLVVADIGMFFANVREAVLARLDLRPEELLLTATHTHAGPGGFSGYRMYGTTNGGIRPPTLAALVDGVVLSVQRALADLAPGRLVLTRGELHDASVNRSPGAFARNPEQDRAAFPGGIDPTATVLRLEREGRLVGLVHWFATHGTSLSNRNRLVSGDNKGWAAWAWESADRAVVAAFAQTNAGDVSPNVPDATRGPTPDDVANTAEIGQRQLRSARELAREDGREVHGPLALRLSYVDLPGLAVDGHRTGRAVLGAAFAAGTEEGPGAKQFAEGVESNRLLSVCSGLLYRLRPAVGDAHAPKAMLLPVGALGWHASRLPVHLVRLGPLVLVGLAQEVTVVAGLRLRRAVAEALQVPVEDVLVQGYANDYAGYVTTPEEYDAQRYEGGHTAFGRWTLPAYVQEVVRVATDLRDDRPTRTAGPPVLKPVPVAEAAEPEPTPGCRWTGTPVLQGESVTAELTGDDPRGRPRERYLRVERRDGDGWAVVAEDGTWPVVLRWRRDEAGWTVAVRWSAGQAVGAHRLTWVDRAGAEVPSEELLLPTA
jgi:neutral ceramidase